MLRYPLRFKASETPAESALTILDAKKEPVLFRPKITEEMQSGKVMGVIYAGDSAGQPLYNTLHQESEQGVSYLIRNPDCALLGKLVVESKHKWKVLDALEQPVASIYETGTWKDSCLVQLLIMPLDTGLWDELLKAVSPRRFRVTIQEETVLDLREVVSQFVEDFELKKSGDFLEWQEALLLASLMTIL
jgi:hypothetical protein